MANTEEADAEEEFLRGVELTGEETSLLASDFLMWRAKTEEIVYRRQGSSRCFVVFSRLDEERFLRPEGVFGPLTFSESDLEELEKKQLIDDAKEVVLSRESMGFSPEGEIDARSLQDALFRLYATNPRKKIVTLDEELPPYFFLMALDWFVGKAHAIKSGGREL